jgi:hypothetical protein
MVKLVILLIIMGNNLKSKYLKIRAEVNIAFKVLKAGSIAYDDLNFFLSNLF